MAMKNETDDEMKRYSTITLSDTLSGWVVFLMFFVIGPIIGVIVISGITLVAYVIAHILGIDWH